MSEQRTDPVTNGRNETPLERSDRNLVELLQEVRVVQTGVQVLFGFLLMAPLTTRFRAVAPAVRIEYYITMLAAGGAAMLLMAPTAYHRILFRCGDKEHLVTVSNRFTLAGLTLVGVAMLGSLVFVSAVLFSETVAIGAGAATSLTMTWCWCLAPLHRRARVRGTGAQRPDGHRVVPLR
jgi:hypothetical protein